MVNNIIDKYRELTAEGPKLTFMEFSNIFPNECYCNEPADSCDTGYSYHDEYAECDCCLYGDAEAAYQDYILPFLPLNEMLKYINKDK